MIVLAGFGAYSMYVCALAANPKASTAWFCLIATVAATLFVWAISHLALQGRVPKSEWIGRYRKFYAIRFFAILAVEVTAIVLAGPVLGHFQRTDLVPQWIDLVVGIHFAPLGKVFQMPIYYGTAAMIVASSLGSLLMSTSSLRLAMNAGGTGLTLWITAFIILGSDVSHLRKPG